MNSQKTCYNLVPLVLVMLGLFLFNQVVARQSGQRSCQVVASFPSPGRSPQDLAWDGNYLWVVDDSTDMIYKLDPSTGKVLLSFATPGLEPKGLACDGKHLWLSENRTAKIYKFDLSNKSLNTPISAIDAPVIKLGRRGRSPISGLAWDGQYLWSAYEAGYSTSIVKIDPQDGSILERHFTRGAPEGLASDGTYLWYTSIRGGQGWLGLIRACYIDSWYYSFKFETPGYFPTGLAWDGTYLWIADRGAKRIYKVMIK